MTKDKQTTESLQRSLDYWKITVEQLEAILPEMTAREQKVLTLRWGLKNGVRMTYEAIGKEMGLTRERIRQIQEKALCKISDHTNPTP